jgi:hypothetical protein
MGHKFKVGDKVKILPRKSEWIHWGPHYTDEMRIYENHICTLVAPSGLDWKMEEIGCLWSPLWFVPVKKKIFK